MSTAPLLDVRNLRVEYRSERGPVRAVDDVSFSIAPGEVFGLAGESGSGKSTIAMAVMRVLHPPAAEVTGGQVLLAGRDVLALEGAELEDLRWRTVSMVFQSAMNALNPVMTVGDQIVDAIRAHERVTRRQAWERAVELLDLTGIEAARARAYPHQLSGGMRQRAVIAMALCLSPRLIIMDEPTTGLDVVVQREIMQQIEELKDRLGFSILFITHDLSLLIELCSRAAIMYAGKIVEQASAADLFHAPRHPYTQGLMHCFPSISGEKRKLAGIPGSPPDMAAPPGGCRFHPRCPYAQPAFREAVPELLEVAPDHLVACHLAQEDGHARDR
jgi:peptide/nickel transport system ATP-binding protein